MIKSIRESLVFKWTVFSIMLATVPLAIAGFSIIQIYQKDLKKSVIMTEKEKANMVAERIRSFVEKIASNLRSLSIDEHFREGSSPGHIKSLLESFLNRNDYVLELTLLNEKGMETTKVSKYRVFGPSDLKDQSKTKMFQVASSLQIYYGDFKLAENVVPTMVIAIPIEEYRRRPEYVLSAEISLTYLWNVISQTQIGQKGSIYVVDGKGDLIAHPDTKLVASRTNVRHLPMVDRAVAGEEGNLEFEDSGGEKYLVVHKPIKELGWGVVVQLPVEEAYTPLRQVTHTALKWILIALGVAIALSVFLTGRLILPIKHLSKEMGEVSKGNLDICVQPTTKDELGLLTKSFNRMIQDLKQSHEAFKKAEEKYRRVFEESKDMFYITSMDGKFIEVNQAGVDMLGYEDREELFKISVGETYLYPEDRQRFQNEVIKEGFIKDFEVKLKRKDGTPMDVLITATVRKNEEDHVTGYEGIIKNISGRKRMEEELVQSTKELQSLYDLSKLINQSLDLNEVLSIALDKVMELTGFEMGGIYLLQENGEVFEFKYHKGFGPRFVENVRFLKFGEGICGKAVKLKQPLGLSIGEYPSPQILPFLREEGIQSLISFPLLAKEKPIGAINLASRSPHFFGPKEINLLGSLGNQIGLALENAKLFSAVAKAKSEWETTFDAVTDLITIRDKDYRIIRVNRAAFKRFGLEVGEAIGKKCYEILHHREIPCEGCYVSETLRTKKPATGERESQYLKGVFQYFTFPIRDEAGEVVAVVDLAREITEEKRLATEKEVVNNINRILASSLDVRQVIKSVHSELKRVLDSDRMTITLLDEGGKGFQYFVLEKDDDAKERVSGMIYPKEGTPFSKVVDTVLPVIVPDTEESDSWVDRKLLKEGIRSSLVFPLEYKGKIIGTVNFGSKETAHFSERQFDLLRQISPGLAISIQNFLLLEKLKASEERYRTVVEGAHDGVIVAGEDYRFKYVNERLGEITGYTREELIGMDFRILLDEEGKRLAADRYVRKRREKEGFPRYELNIIRKSGEIKNVEISATIVKDSQGNVNTVAFIKDITEKKRIEEQLVQTEKLRALGEMASGVAHDFNNALAVILGNTQLMLYTLKDEELRKTLQTMEKVAKDAAQTVRRLQDFTRKKTHQELNKLDINSIVKDAIEITKPKWKDEAQQKGIHIEMFSNFEEIPYAEGNASELREVITNMIFNSIEAMPEGGQIEIRTFWKKEKVCIRISDTGIGMTEEVRKKVFEPFFTTKPFSNTGLGLSMSYGIIKRFGGDIEVKTMVGHGTTFTISLPVAEKEEEMADRSTIEKGKEARILVIDDEASVRSVLSQILSQVNHQVKVAENGEEGLRLFKEREFDIVLTDLGMPGLSGWEVCRAIKKFSPRTPVGMITGWGTEVDQTKIKETGLDFLISKPFDFNQVLKVVAETMEFKEKRFMS